MFLEKNSFKTELTCQPPSKVIPPFFFFFFLSFFLFCAHIMSYVNYVSKAWDGCACVHMKQLYSLHKRAIKFLMPSPNMDYNQKCCALKLLPLDKQLVLNKCVLMQKVVHGKAPQYLKYLMIPSECLHVRGNKQLLPRTRIDIFATVYM